jgi:hypothetical protein
LEFNVKERMERKMDTNTNFSNSNTRIDAGILPAMDYHQEISGELSNPAVITPATIVNCSWMESVTKRRGDFLADRGSFANEQ